MTQHRQNGSAGSDEPRFENRKRSLVRMYILTGVFMLGFFSVAVKLFIVQVRDQEKLREQARMQYESREIIPAVRGLILDRNLSILASNITEYSLVADPGVIDRPDTVVRYLRAFLPGTPASYMAKLRDTTRRFVVLENNLPESVAAHFRNWKCYGIRLRPTPRRSYNFCALAGPIIGYTNIDNKGQSGIELEMESELAGEEGYIVYHRNARGMRRPDVDLPRREPVNGRTVVLTISQAYQSIAEEELAKGVGKYAAESGRCIVLQPRTGEVLAMANFPSIDPNNLAEYTPEKARNRAVTDLYEPGSTFKLVAMSAALNERIHEPDDVLSAENGSWCYSSSQKPIVDDHPYQRLSLRGAFEHSSNIISAKLAEKLGAERFYKYARNFGFGVQTGIELPGELRGDLRKPVDWEPITLKYLAFGYGLAVTSIQIACAYATIANDGVLMRPFIRKWLLDENRNIVDETVPQTIRRVVSTETAATMRDFMRGVVDSGTGRLARIDGMEIGGKTGTSQRLVNGSYSDMSHVASFVGYFPVDDPKILILVILDAPRNGYYGGSVAAPIFREIALRIINSTPDFARKPDPIVTAGLNRSATTVPDVRGMKAGAARAALESRGLVAQLSGAAGDIVRDQTPQPGSQAELRTAVSLEVIRRGKDAREEPRIMPRIEGMTLRQAVSMLRALSLEPSAVGGGIVRTQYPAPGEPVRAGMRCSLLCEPRTISTAMIY
jgi:cell division protein FtsI (penicillin-binding protein 3)